jgi:hypothetical protein
MSKSDSGGGSENQWEDRGDLAWNEFDWERYLREQDAVINRYLDFYESSPPSAERLDRVAEKMDWGQGDWSDDRDDDGEDDDADDGATTDQEDVYTLHKNPIFIATKAIYLGLSRSWQTLAADSTKIPQPAAIALLVSFQRGEEQASEAIHALDFGDYAMAVSLFKRALSALNRSMALVTNDEGALAPADVVAWRQEALARCFDLREIWLRVISECREVVERPIDEDDES